MGMCTLCGGRTFFDEDLGEMVCESCGWDGKEILWRTL